MTSGWDWTLSTGMSVGWLCGVGWVYIKMEQMYIEYCYGKSNIPESESVSILDVVLAVGVGFCSFELSLCWSALKSSDASLWNWIQKNYIQWPDFIKQQVGRGIYFVQLNRILMVHQLRQSCLQKVHRFDGVHFGRFLILEFAHEKLALLQNLLPTGSNTQRSNTNLGYSRFFGNK